MIVMLAAVLRSSWGRRLFLASLAVFAVVTVLALVPERAVAQSFDLTGISTVESQAEGWFSTAQTWAQRTYGLLFVVELTIIGVQGVLFRDNLAEFMAGVAFKVFVAGFFMFLIANAQPLFTGVVHGLRDAGQQLGGSSDGGMYGVIAQGLAAAGLMFGAADIARLTDNLASIPVIDIQGALTAIVGETGMGTAVATAHGNFELLVQAIGMIMVFAMAAILIQYVMITIESFIVMGAGVMFLGFSGTRFTMPFSQGYISYAFNVGVKLFTFYLLLGVVNSLMPNALIFAGATAASAAIPGAEGAAVALIPAVIAAFEMVLIATILYAVPQFAAAFLSGSSSMGAGQFMSTVTSAVGSMAQLQVGAMGLHNARNNETALETSSEMRKMEREIHGPPAGRAGMASDQMAPSDHGRTALAEHGLAGPAGAAQPVAAAQGPDAAVLPPAQRPAMASGADAVAPVAGRPAQAPVPAGRPAAQLSSGATRSESADDDFAGSRDRTASFVSLNGNGAPNYALSGGPGAPAGAQNGEPPQARHQPIGREESLVALQRQGTLEARLRNTDIGDMHAHVEEMREHPEIAAIVERHYGRELDRNGQEQLYGRMMEAGALRGFAPAPDAPVNGIQIRLGNPDRL